MATPNEITAATNAITALRDAAVILGSQSDPQGQAAACRALTAIDGLRLVFCDIEAEIRKCSANGLTREKARSVMGISRYRFATLCSVIPDLTWANANTLKAKKANAGHGPMTPEKLSALYLEKTRRFEICGVRGNLKELLTLWQDHVSVGYPTLVYRVAKGWPLYDAFFLPQKVNRQSKAA